MGNCCCNNEDSKYEIKASDSIELDNKKMINFPMTNIPSKETSVKTQKQANIDLIALHAPPSDKAKQKRKMNSMARGVEDIIASLPNFKIPSNLGKSGNLEPEGPVLGPYEYNDGSTYKGQFFNGERHGLGTLIWQDGSVYKGQFRNDKCHGKGFLVHAEGDAYQGSWSEDRAHGYGYYIDSNGTSYEGDWRLDAQHGYGEEKWENGRVYKGNFFSSEKHGYGVFQWEDGSKYKGNFNHNKLDGEGKDLAWLT